MRPISVLCSRATGDGDSDYLLHVLVTEDEWGNFGGIYDPSWKTDAPADETLRKFIEGYALDEAISPAEGVFSGADPS
jgi:hypothetical protein